MIELRGITWTAGGRRLLDGLSFTIAKGEYAVLMGQTGCGKTSLLEIVCGLRTPKSGRVLFDNADVTDWEPKQRGIGYLPQDLALFPNIRVRDQISFPLRIRRVPFETRTLELAEELAIRPLLDRRPETLSGGEKQRVALARALATSPRMLLLDEPLSALDEEKRAEAMKLLKRVQAEHKLTVLHVTHSRSEAEKLATMRLSMNDGKITVE